MQKLKSTHFKCLLLVVLASCNSSAQPDLTKLTDEQWHEDLDYLTSRINKSFAGFTKETQAHFADQEGQLNSTLNQLTPQEKILAMAKLLATLQDGHTEVSLVGTSSQFRRYPITLYYFQNDLYVIATDELHRDVVGSIVKSIDGMPVDTVLGLLKPYINRDNDIEYRTTAPFFMAIPEILFSLKISRHPDNVTFTVDKDGSNVDFELNAITLRDFNNMKRIRAYSTTPFYLENPEKTNWIRFLPEEKILYMSFSSLFNPDNEPSIKKLISDAFAEFDSRGAQRLVVDFRQCRGGNYHNAEPLLKEIKKRNVLQQDRHVIVINGRLTFSAASVATLFLKDDAGALIVGEVSRARPNWAENAESYFLPNSKLKFDCLEKTSIHSPRLGSSLTIPVDIEIPKTFNDYKEGKDEVLEYIRANLK